jgi:hypothetical protein
MEPSPLPTPKPGAFDAYRQPAKILESIADRYAPGSVESETLKRAAFALLFATAYFPEQFEAFIPQFPADLSDEQKAHLRSMGIDPDER